MEFEVHSPGRKVSGLDKFSEPDWTSEKKVFDQNGIQVIQNNFHRIQAWANLDRITKEKLRKIEFSYLIKKAGRLRFPKDSEKQNLKAHDCLHSYAVHLLNSGVSISLIAKSLGNSVLVCEKYYLGYALQEEGIQMIHQMMSQAKLKRVS